MPNDDLKTRNTHHVIMQNREKLSLSGVEDVEQFDDREIVMLTTHGRLTVSGSDLHIGRLSLEEGDLSIEGVIDCLQYSAREHSGRGMLSRLFG